MGRPGRDLDALNHFFKLDAKSILPRCAEILQSVHGTDTSTEEGPRVGSKHQSGINRVIDRLSLGSRSAKASVARRTSQELLHELTPSLASNLARHARTCCTPTHPKCELCPLISFCPSGMKRATESRKGGPVAVDLFAGAGGLSAGFRREGFQVALAVEKDRHAAQSYRVNNPGVPVIEGDVRKIHPSSILRALGLRRGQVTAIIAGPPCQGFSAAGPRKPRARRNFLYHRIADIARGLSAQILIMENVLGLRRVNGISFENRILDHFRRAGYFGVAIEVDASKFGVPQRRKRLIFMCARKSHHISAFTLRPLVLGDRTTVLIALKGLPRPSGRSNNGQRVGREMIYNHRPMAHSAKVIAKIKRIKAGEGPISYRRLRPDLAHTLIAGHRAMPVHPRQHRTITVREAARLQTMPDTFRFLGPHAEQPLQVANVVPYMLSRAIARSTLFSLDDRPLRPD
jgi:DNA (cytosine-5)-methyltransferase 1